MRSSSGFPRIIVDTESTLVTDASDTGAWAAMLARKKGIGGPISPCSLAGREKVWHDQKWTSGDGPYLQKVENKSRSIFQLHRRSQRDTIAQHQGEDGCIFTSSSRWDTSTRKVGTVSVSGYQWSCLLIGGTEVDGSDAIWKMFSKWKRQDDDPETRSREDTVRTGNWDGVVKYGAWEIFLNEKEGVPVVEVQRR